MSAAAVMNGPVFIQQDKLKAAYYWANTRKTGPERDYANAYIRWLRNGAEGLEPERGRTTRAQASGIRAHIDGMKLWVGAETNPNYRVEHIAKTPEGWHTRTKMMATHYVVLAFPPGRRKKGSGKLIEIMHPANENPCTFNRAIGGRRANPAGDAAEQAEHLYREFHGTDPREIVEMQESDAARHTFTALGDLSQLVIHAPAGTIKIDFSHSDAVKVASAPGGRQLYLLGGNQNIDSALEQFGSDPRKDFVELGEGKQITYSARKKFDDFRLVDYYHNLGEETGERPILFYDRMKKRIFFVGGRYRVEAPGIIN